MHRFLEPETVPKGTIGWYWHNGERLYWMWSPAPELIEWLENIQTKFLIASFEAQYTDAWVVWTIRDPNDEFWLKMRWPLIEASIPWTDYDWWDAWWEHTGDDEEPEDHLNLSRIGQYRFRKNSVSPNWCGPKKTKRVR